MKENKLSIKVNGLKEVEELKFHEIEGGFGEGKKSMLVNDIASIHNRELKKINELINNNRKRFNDNIDIIDLKASPFEGLGYEKIGYSKQSFNQSKNIYILSERGYSKLLKILEDDFAWKQYEKIVDGYFDMRADAKNSNEEMKLIVQDMFNGLKTLVVDFEGKFEKSITVLDEKLNKLEDKQEELDDYYKPTHKKKLGLNGFIKSCLGDNSSKENVGRATEQLLLLLGNYETYQEVPKDILEDVSTKALAYDICKNINISIKGID